MTDHRSDERAGEPDFGDLTSGAPDALARFAHRNGWEFYAYTDEVRLPGLVFHEPDGSERLMGAAADLVRLPGPLLTEVGTSAYLSQPAGTVVGMRWGYIALQLDVPVAPFVLQSRRTARLRPLPTLPVLPKGARPSLVGDGDRTFELYTDAGSQSAARALLTGRILSLLDDGEVAFALEATPGWLFVYSPEPLSTRDARVWRRVLALIDALRSQTASVATSHAGIGTMVALPMRSNAGAVDRRRVIAYYAAAAAVAGVLAAVVAVFMPR
ncbi:hypothetical protein ACEXQB_000920 [Herbiconiux sp. P18]|uniref:hypothetical protein n=1 Tax=Herbiconiux liangxiaofengii TaxID=3342795 RepID=UPI0035BA54FD